VQVSASGKFAPPAFLPTTSQVLCRTPHFAPFQCNFSNNWRSPADVSGDVTDCCNPAVKKSWKQAFRCKRCVFQQQL